MRKKHAVTTPQPEQWRDWDQVVSLTVTYAGRERTLAITLVHQVSSLLEWMLGEFGHPAPIEAVKTHGLYLADGRECQPKSFWLFMLGVRAGATLSIRPSPQQEEEAPG